MRTKGLDDTIASLQRDIAEVFAATTRVRRGDIDVYRENW